MRITHEPFTLGTLPDDLPSRLEFARREALRLEARLAEVEASKTLQLVRRLGISAQALKSRLGQALLKSPFHGLFVALTRPDQQHDPYQDFISQEQHPTSDTTAWPQRPVISLLTAVYKTNPAWLEEAAASVKGQTYPHWQWCLAVDDATNSPETVALVKQLVDSDPRIVMTTMPTQSGISNTLNAASTLAMGDYLGVLDHDDVLSKHCLYYCADTAVRHQVGVVYTDEDYVDSDGQRRQPSFKPEWSPDLLQSCMYWGHFWMAKRELWEPFCQEFDGAQDHHLALRISKRMTSVARVPRVLYHWRRHAGSTASHSSAKPYAHDAGLSALKQVTGYTITKGARMHTYCTRYPSGTAPTIIICSRNPQLLEKSLASLKDIDAQRIVVHHTIGDAPGIPELCSKYNAQRLEWTKPFQFSEMNNLAASHATQPWLLFLNDDVYPGSPGWLDALSGHMTRDGVGIAGAKLLYPSRLLQHAGIALGGPEGTVHVARYQIDSDLWHWLHVTREVSAVTGACLAIKAELFQQLGGFDPAFPVNYNDVDLCLRCWDAGRRVIFEPGARLIHHEAQTRWAGTTYVERETFYLRWRERLSRPDPYFSPNLDASQERIRLGQPVLQFEK